MQPALPLRRRSVDENAYARTESPLGRKGIRRFTQIEVIAQRDSAVFGPENAPLLKNRNDKVDEVLQRSRQDSGDNRESVHRAAPPPGFDMISHLYRITDYHTMTAQEFGQQMTNSVAGQCCIIGERREESLGADTTGRQVQHMRGERRIQVELFVRESQPRREPANGCTLWTKARLKFVEPLSRRVFGLGNDRHQSGQNPDLIRIAAECSSFRPDLRGELS